PRRPSDDERAFVPDDAGRGPVREIAVRHRDRITERVCEIAEARAKDDADPRNLGDATAYRVRGLAYLFVVAHYRRKPAMVAVMKWAGAPANSARGPRGARWWRRFGASAPIPPI